MTQQFTISASRPDGTPIPVVVTKKRVKNFNLRVTSSGEVHASAPLGATRERIEAFVKRNSAVDFQSQRNSLNGPRVSAASATRK